jgi:MtN3 and saliva related transmembrane protein
MDQPLAQVYKIHMHPTISFPLIVATLAPIVNSVQLAPQLYKTYITKSSKDLSIYSLSLILATNLLWILHGYFIMDTSLLVASLIGFVINISLVFLVIYERKIFT